VEVRDEFGSMSELEASITKFFISTFIPCPMTRYNSLQVRWQLSIFESSIFEISNFGFVVHSDWWGGVECDQGLDSESLFQHGNMDTGCTAQRRL